MSDITRRLATVQRISEVQPITRVNEETGETETADAIFAAKILGWWVVIRYDTGLKEGDLVVFFEIDSCLPDWPMFEEMLRGKPWSPKASRLKTVRFWGQVSQGYARSAEEVIDYISELRPYACAGRPYGHPLEEGTDVTELTETTLYEPPAPTDTATLAGHWIPGVPKTDEERIQSAPELARKLSGEPYIITVKIEGQSGTFGHDNDGEFWSCSRNFRLRHNDATPHGKVALRYNLADIIHTTGRRLIIQGEVAGPGIQSNVLGLTDHDLYVFDVFDYDNDQYFSAVELQKFCAACSLKMVPVIEVGRSFNYTPDELVRMSAGKYPNGHPREGIVIRHKYHTGRDRISFKAVDPLYLLTMKGKV